MDILSETLKAIHQFSWDLRILLTLQWFYNRLCETFETSVERLQSFSICRRFLGHIVVISVCVDRKRKFSFTSAISISFMAAVIAPFAGIGMPVRAAFAKTKVVLKMFLVTILVFDDGVVDEMAVELGVS